MRAILSLCAAGIVLSGAAVALAQQAGAPTGNFGGGALVAPGKDLFGPGNAVIGLRALPRRKLEIEASVRARCAGGDILAATKIAADGSFAADGSETAEPSPGEKVKTTYRLSGSLGAQASAGGTLSATLVRTAEGREPETCRTGTIRFQARRPGSELGDREARPRAFYYGTTTQRGTGPKRPIVLRMSGDRTRLARALFGEQVTCSDDKRSIGIEAPRTNLTIDGEGGVSDHETDRIDNGETYTYIDDRFTATIGRAGAKGTFSLSDRTVDKASGNVIQSCRSGTVHWLASP